MRKESKLKNKNGIYFSIIFGRLYQEVPDLPFNEKLKNYPSELHDYIDYIYKTFGCKHDDIIQDEFFGNSQMISDSYRLDVISKLQKNYIPNNKILIAFSGGKDSVAAVIRAKEQYEPILFYIEGLASVNEYKHACITANKLNVEILEPYKVIVNNKKPDAKYEPIIKENPIKNQYILSCMVDYALQNNIRNFAFGNHLSESLRHASNINYNFSDYIEGFLVIQDYYQKYLNNFKLITFVNSDTDSALEILKTDYKLYDNIFSCMTRSDGKVGAIKANLNNYCKALPETWCGSCYKCAWNYILFHQLGLVDNENFFNHCIAELMQKMVDRFPHHQNHPNFTYQNIFDLWYDEVLIKQFKTNDYLLTEIKEYFRYKDLFCNLS